MLLTVTRLYFSSEEGGERSVCLTFAFVFLLLAMLVQVVPDTTLELGLEPGRSSATIWGQRSKLSQCMSGKRPRASRRPAAQHEMSFTWGDL